MGRVSTFDDETVFAAVTALLTARGELRLQDLVEKTGISIGSLYHRYGSRESLLAQIWLDAVQAFQMEIKPHFDAGTIESGEQAALTVPRFCREHHARAVVLACCRAAEFCGPKTPADMVSDINAAQTHAKDAVADFAAAAKIPADAAHLGIVAFPLGAVRMYLPGRPVPESLDESIRAAYWAAIRPAS